MLDTIWGLPWEVSVPMVEAGQSGCPAAVLVSVNSCAGGEWRGNGPSFSTMIVGVWPPKDMLRLYAWYAWYA